MIYTELTKKAMRLSFEMHKDQTDKAGLPYFYHPLLVADQMTDELSCVTALLHDLVEDTEVSFTDLEGMGYPEDVIDALKLLTHDDETPYLEYVRRIKKNSIARAVKLADLTHNSDLSRLTEVKEKDLLRVEKYKKAKEILLAEEV